MNIPRSVCRARFRTDGGNTKENRSLLSDFAKEARTSEIGAVLGRLEFSVCARIGATVSNVLQTDYNNQFHLPNGLCMNNATAPFS
jgi:hypothetical protein